MSYAIKQSSTQSVLMFLLIQSSDHITGLTGASPTVTISKNGGSFGSPAGAVSEVGSGWYKVAGNATDTNTLGPLALHATAASADPSDSLVAEIVAYDPQDATHLGLSSLPNTAVTTNASLLTSGTGTDQLSVSSGKVTLLNPPGIRKNVALNDFEFLMTDSTTNQPKTGLTVTVTRSIDNGAFAAGTLSAVTEISNGIYSVNFGSGDLNGGVVTLQATAAGANSLFVTIPTNP